MSYGAMFGGGSPEDRKQSLIKKLASQRTGTSGGAGKLANMFQFNSGARRGFQAANQNTAFFNPMEALQGGPGGQGLDVLQGIQAGNTPGAGGFDPGMFPGGSPTGPSLAPVHGVGPAAGPGSGSPGTPQGGPQGGPAQNPDAPNGGAPYWLLDGSNPGGQVPGWVQQQMDSGINSGALAAWLAANPWFLNPPPTQGGIL